VAKDYESMENVYEQKLPEGTAIAATWPNEVFVTLVATSLTRPARFEISYFYEDRDEYEDVVVVVPEPIVEEEEEGVDIFLVLTIVLLAFVVIIILVIVCCYIKLQSEQNM